MHYEIGNPHDVCVVQAVLAALERIDGVVVRYVLGANIIVAVFPKQNMELHDAFHSVCHYLKETQSIKFQRPNSDTRRKRLAPEVTSIVAVGDMQISRPLNIWMRLPTVGDLAPREVETEIGLRQRVLGEVSLEELETGRRMQRFMGRTLIRVLSHIKFVQKKILR